jgi:Domain of unknown function (DUF4037)
MAAPALELARRVAASFAAIPDVEAVALGGSRASQMAGDDSDVDLYVYASPEPPLERRAAIASAAAGRLELDNHFFETGDEWVDGPTGLALDVMYRGPRWIEDQLDRVLVRHEASVGYSTALWHSVHRSVPLFDRRGWYASLQARAAAPYPEPLRRAIVARNQPLLRDNLSSYLRQLERAVARGDAVSANHRVAAFLASYFDILFAVHRVPHPGEKRLVTIARQRCPRAPAGFDAAITALVASLPGPDTVPRADLLAEELDALLLQEGLLER